ncbi:MAG: hypothetical protein R3A48_19010 [Polyangiales bacterium]
MTRHLCALALAATTALPATAQAIEIYASTPGTVVVPSPRVYVPPVTTVVIPSPRVYVRSTPRLYIPPADPPADPPTHPQPQERRDPRTAVFVGAGYGGMTGFQGSAAGTFRLHLGLGLGATEIGIRADIANRALDALANTQPGNVYLISAEVAHRFLEGSTVRPVLGLSFDRWQVDADNGASAGAFGVGARAGAEVHYHLNPNAALVFGADLGYHRVLTAIDGVSVAPDVLTFGATIDIRL